MQFLVYTCKRYVILYYYRQYLFMNIHWFVLSVIIDDIVTFSFWRYWWRLHGLCDIIAMIKVEYFIKDGEIILEHNFWLFHHRARTGCERFIRPASFIVASKQTYSSLFAIKQNFKSKIDEDVEEAVKNLF